MAKADLTAQRLRELVHYDPETGEITWRARRTAEFSSYRAACAWNARYAGTLAGHASRAGYVTMMGHYAHRLAWLYSTGSSALGEIDHKDGDRANNRLANLRDVDREMNAQNMRRPMSGRSQNLPLGVTFLARKRERSYVASINVGAKRLHIGYFDTPEEAHEAYIAKKRRHHPGGML